MYTADFAQNYRPIVTPKSTMVDCTDKSPVDSEKILDRLQKAARLCNLLIKGKRVPGFHPGRDLSEKEIETLKVGMSHLSFTLRNTSLWPRTIDFELESFCDCKTTIGCLKAIGINTLWDIVKSADDDYPKCLAIAEHIWNAERQYHMLALVERPAANN